MNLHEQIRQAIAASINDCIRNDSSFGSYADAAIEAVMEVLGKQEPVAWMLNCQTLGGDTGWILSWTQSGAGLCNRLPGTENEKKLYTLPGAKGEEK